MDEIALGSSDFHINKEKPETYSVSHLCIKQIQFVTDREQMYFTWEDVSFEVPIPKSE